MRCRSWLNLPLLFPVLILFCEMEWPACSAGPATNSISPEQMRRVYEAVKTPYKYGVIIRPEPDSVVDCPNVFRFGDHWYMLHVASSKKAGYETHLARSENLLDWTPLGKVLSFQKTGWDKWQADGGIALVDPAWDGSYMPEKFDGKYWMSYIGGALQGYEPDPLAIGMAWTTTPDQPTEWNRIPENPVLSRDQPDVRSFEKITLYKSTIIHDRSGALGAPFVMFYNGKIRNAYEKIGIAVSKDMIHWKRYGTEPVISNGDEQSRGISGDPQIVRMDNLWVMFYFGAFWKPGAFDTFACSTDLVHWTKWEGPHLIEPSEPWDQTYAHKPWIVYHNGVVYHYYCAVGTEGRTIAVATSKDLGRSKIGTKAKPE